MGQALRLLVVLRGRTCRGQYVPRPTWQSALGGCRGQGWDGRDTGAIHRRAPLAPLRPCAPGHLLPQAPVHVIRPRVCLRTAAPCYCPGLCGHSDVQQHQRSDFVFLQELAWDTGQVSSVILDPSIEGGVAGIFFWFYLASLAKGCSGGSPRSEVSIPSAGGQPHRFPGRLGPMALHLQYPTAAYALDRAPDGAVYLKKPTHGLLVGWGTQTCRWLVHSQT